MSTCFKSILAMVMEGDSAGLTQEIEYTHFYKLSDISELQKASEFIEQEQWQVQKPGGCIRVRKSSRSTLNSNEVSVGTPTYWLTTKLNLKGVVGRPECTVEVTEELFNHFRKIADNGLQKLRCVFPIVGTEGTFKEPGAKFNGALCWEVDLFKDKFGVFCPWVKVDLEVPEPLTTLPQFPLKVSKSIVSGYDSRTAEETEIIEGLFENVYNLTCKDFEGVGEVNPPTD